MGLAIKGLHSKREYTGGTGGLHEIRALAVWIGKDLSSFEEAFKFLVITSREDELFQKNYYDWIRREDLLSFRQLLHFSDIEGIFILDRYLEGIDYSHSFHLGSLDELYEELEVIRETVTSDMKRYNVPFQAMQAFWSLYNLIKDELEHGVAVWFM